MQMLVKGLLAQLQHHCAISSALQCVRNSQLLIIVSATTAPCDLLECMQSRASVHQIKL